MDSFLLSIILVILGCAGICLVFAISLKQLPKNLSQHEKYMKNKKKLMKYSIFIFIVMDITIFVGCLELLEKNFIYLALIFFLLVIVYAFLAYQARIAPWIRVFKSNVTIRFDNILSPHSTHKIVLLAVDGVPEGRGIVTIEEANKVNITAGFHHFQFMVVEESHGRSNEDATALFHDEIKIELQRNELYIMEEDFEHKKLAMTPMSKLIQKNTLNNS